MRAGYAACGSTATRLAVAPLPILSHTGELWAHGRRWNEATDSSSVTPYPMIATTIFWVAVVLCVIAHRYILRSAFAAGAAVDHSHTLPPIRKAAEVLWVVLPAVALVFLLIATWRAIETRNALHAAPASSEAVA